MAVLKTRNSSLLFIWLLFNSHIPQVSAEWRVGQQTLADASTQVMAAHTTNSGGYSLAVYRNADAIMARFALAGSMLGLGKDACPTYQIDNAAPDNRSYNTGQCNAAANAAEFVLGEINDNQVRSALLLAVLNGKQIQFRFRLEDGGYRETAISLAGSKRAMTDAIGANIAIHAP